MALNNKIRKVRAKVDSVNQGLSIISTWIDNHTKSVLGIHGKTAQAKQTLNKITEPLIRDYQKLAETKTLLDAKLSKLLNQRGFYGARRIKR